MLQLLRNRAKSRSVDALGKEIDKHERVVSVTKPSGLITLCWNTVLKNECFYFSGQKPAVVVIRLLAHCKVCNEHYNLIYSYIKSRVKLNDNLVLSKLCNLPKC